MEPTENLPIGKAENLPPRNAEQQLLSIMLDIGVGAEMAKKIMSFWMFLESKGFKNIFNNMIFANDKHFIRCLCAEAEVALAFLERESDPTRPNSSTTPISCPITWQLAGPYLIRKNVLGDKARTCSGISAFRSNVSFEDILDKRGKKDNPQDPNVQNVKTGGERTGSESAQSFASNLSPLAEEWHPKSEDERSLFLTFSKGNPISKVEIITHFKRQYGDCVENVFIYKPQDKDPEFGKIVFKLSWIPILILKNSDKAVVYIAGRSMRLKKYKPQVCSS